MRVRVNNMTKYQTTLFKDDAVFPSTRFQGSKLKIVDWIWEAIKGLDFDTVLDAFGGTGCIGYMLKGRGKTVTYNDILKFNWCIGLALIENDRTKLSEEDVHFLVTRHENTEYGTFVSDTFKDIYFTDEENQWIDMVVKNITLLNDRLKEGLALFALFQACIIKRPFNLFHRKNLYLRFSDVKRNFGNKATWDRPFEDHFKQFVHEANHAVFEGKNRCSALNSDVFAVEGEFDLVYIDTPYISHKGSGVDYYHFYHFLEGLVDYSQWPHMIDYRTKHKRLRKRHSVWTDKNEINEAFDRLFAKFRSSILVVSYRSDGIPCINELANLLKKYKTKVHESRRKEYKYVLSSNHSEEVLLIGE